MARPDRQGQGEVRQHVVVDGVVDPAVGPDPLDEGLDVVPAALDPLGLDDPQLRVAVGPREGLELQEVPAARRVGEDLAGRGDDHGQRGHGSPGRPRQLRACAIRSAASEVTFSAMTVANSSARPPVSFRTRYWETPASWATWRTPTPS